MNEFDELLNSILHEDANPHVPSGMTQRVVALLAQQKEHTRHRKTTLLGAAAAALVLSLATWTFTRARIVLPAPIPEAAVAQTRSHAFLHPADGQAISSRPRTVPARLKAAANSPRAHPLFAQHDLQHDIEIPPIDIEPIFIEPIEIAAVTQSTSTTKGTP